MKRRTINERELRFYLLLAAVVVLCLLLALPSSLLP